MTFIGLQSGGAKRHRQAPHVPGSL
jgi:hypothetical protein